MMNRCIGSPTEIVTMAGIRVLEGRVEGRRRGGSSCGLPYHLTVADTSRVNIVPSVNTAGNGYKWGDATVRGYIEISKFPWMLEYFREVAGVFRARTLDDHAAAYLSNGRLSMATEANGNLFWNLGDWAYTEGTLYQHYREILSGVQTCLLLPENGAPGIGTVDIDRISDLRGINAVSGQRLMHDFKRIGMLDKDPVTGRPLTSEFAGDFSVVSRLPFLPSVQMAAFLLNVDIVTDRPVETDGMSEYSRAVFGNDIKFMLSKTGELSDLTRKIVSGEMATFRVTEDASQVAQAMDLAGYGEDDYYFDAGSGQFSASFKRSDFGHSITGIDESGNFLLNFKLYTNNNRDGLTIEENLDAFLASASSIGFNIRDALLMSAGGDPRIGINIGMQQLYLLSRSSEGEDLLYKGGRDYGITSALLFTRKE